MAGSNSKKKLKRAIPTSEKENKTTVPVLLLIAGCVAGLIGWKKWREGKKKFKGTAFKFPKASGVKDTSSSAPKGKKAIHREEMARRAEKRMKHLDGPAQSQQGKATGKKEEDPEVAGGNQLYLNSTYVAPSIKKSSSTAERIRTVGDV